VGANAVNRIFTLRDEKKISRAFQEETFHRKAGVPYADRKKSDIHELSNLESEVEEGVINVMTHFFQSIITMFSDIIIVFTLFYQNNLLWMFSIISFFFYTTIRYITYPRIKKGQKEREKIHEKRKNLYGYAMMLNFGFEEFPETFPRFQKIQELYHTVFETRLEAKWINTIPNLVVNVAAEISMLAMLCYTYTSQTRNYFVAVMVVSQLLTVCTEAVASVINMEETLEKYAEYTKAYKKVQTQVQELSPTSGESTSTSRAMSYEPYTSLDVSIPIYEGYTLQTPTGSPLEFHQGDKIFITGNSGQGKTTLAELLSGRDYYHLHPTFGNRRCATYYLPQDYNKTWTQRQYTLDQAFPGLEPDRILQILDAFQFPRNKLPSPSPITKEATFPVMSGGELKRLQYAILMTRDITPSHQVIILDEPHKELDQTTAANMVEGISSLYPDRTIMVIQHEKPNALSHWREWHIEEGVIYQR
jgi:ABC-type transport system involved in cytochrome bd biosynthesis fused ATPase/permease subunit